MHATSRLPRVASSCVALLLAACGEPPTAPAPHPGVHVVVGAGVADTIDTQLLQALVVEVRGPDGSLAHHGTVVQFEAQSPPPDPTRNWWQPALYVCPLTALTCGSPGWAGPQVPTAQWAYDTTDDQGRAKAIVRFGSVAGPAVVRLVVPVLNLTDSATYTVMPGGAVAVRASPVDTALDIGATATLRGRLVDRFNNTRPEPTTITAGPGSAISFDAAARTVTALDIGTQWLFTRYNSLVDSTSVRVVPSGRLVVWSSLEQTVRLVNLNGSGERTLVSGVASDLGAFPRFDPTRQHVTLHSATQNGYGSPDVVIVVDTTGSPRRDIPAAIGFNMVIATRQLADGTVLVVGQRSLDTSHPGNSLWRVAADNTITFLVSVPELASTYGGADISHDGTKVAYVATTPSYALELRILDVSSGSTTLLDASTATYAPRWSAQDDRLAYLVPLTIGSSPPYGGTAVIVNADGTGRRTLGSDLFSPGISWSPDGTYIVGRDGGGLGMRVLRVSDGSTVILRFSSATGCCHDYWQPDWR